MAVARLSIFAVAAAIAVGFPFDADTQGVGSNGGQLISAKSQSIDAAKELMEVLKSPTAIGVMRSQGMEPGK